MLTSTTNINKQGAAVSDQPTNLHYKLKVFKLCTTTHAVG
jgi:hypothetical protein